MKTTTTETTTKSICVKCGGNGSIAAFAHINNGICYACNGSGEYSHPVRKSGRKGLFEVVNEHAIWQFQTIAHYEDCHVGEAMPKGTAQDMMVQAVTGAGRSGKTLFRIRLSDAHGEDHGVSEMKVARRIYKAATENIHPDTFTDEWLGFTPGRCQITRNRRGVSFL